jgi:glucose/mannose transport system substrate-binding protein
MTAAPSAGHVAPRPSSATSVAVPTIGGPATTPAARNCWPIAQGTGMTPIEVWSLWTTGPETSGFTGLLDAFNASNPDLCAFNTEWGSTSGGRLSARILGGHPPETFQVQMGREFNDTYVDIPGGSTMRPIGSDIVYPGAFPAGLVKILAAADGSIYSVPLAVSRTNLLWYNTAVLVENGVSHPPATWDAFNADAAILKKAGLTPLAVGDSGIWATGMIFEDILIAQLGAGGFVGLWIGTTAWTDSRVTAALRELRTIVRSGWINADHGALSWGQAVDRVSSGKAAMTLMGDWADPEFISSGFEGYGWAAAPGNTGVFQVMGDSFALPLKAADPDGAKRLLMFLGTAPAEDMFNPYHGSVPPRLDAGVDPADGLQYTAYQRSAMGNWRTNTIVPSMEHGAAAAPAWKSAIEDAMTSFVANPDVTAAQGALVAAAHRFAPGP